MKSFISPSVRTKALFVASAAAAALALDLTWQDPLAGIVMLAFIGAAFGIRFFRRRRVERLMRSGDLDAVLRRWRESVENVPHPETMGPLMLATAFAAHGWVEQAREHLVQAERGPAWDAALEHRLFLDTLLLTFEGQTTQARYAAGRLERLPLPPIDPGLVERVRSLRGALAAMERAFAHEAEGGDTELMLEVGALSPLVHWPMRYGAAINLLDEGEVLQAMKIVEEAPVWPPQSYFRVFHAEIEAEVERQEPPSSSFET